MASDDKTSLLIPDHNCWRVGKAKKISFLIDAEEYFYAFREAVKLAQETVFICGWDIDSRLALLRQDPNDDFPIMLRDFLNAVASKRKGLQVYILIWDFAMLVGMDREWFPIYKLDWQTHRNIRLVMDDLHPVGASQHQKIVVVDDSLAFAGGLDLTKKRWDTPDHDPADKRRRTPNGEIYRPHHDVQMMLAGEPAADLGYFFRQRWVQVSGSSIPARQDGNHMLIWPESIVADIENCDVGIVRTRARYKELPEVREVEKLYLDSIRLAKKYIYIENQYLTAPKIYRAIAESLQLEEGPEIIIVLPLTTDGWISQYTMDVLRKKALDEILKADRNNRLGVFYAYREGLTRDDSIKIHSKLMISDDILVRIGSSNLNNRSMGLDTECDLALETDRGPRQKKAVANFCHKLLAEHLGVEVSEITKHLNETRSLLQTILRLQGNKRTLKTLEVELDETVELIKEEQFLLDPEKPIEPDKLVEQWLRLNNFEKGGFNKIGLVVIVLGAIGLTIVWRFTPLHGMTSGKHLMDVVEFLKHSDMAWIFVPAAYILGSILFAPISVLIALTILIYGAYQGIVFAIFGSALSGAITYWLGRIMGRKTVRKLAGNKLNRISKRLGSRGVFSTLVIRLLPIAPYSIVNIVAGATHIRFGDFMLGTCLGMLPGTLAIAGLIDRGLALFNNLNPMTVLSLLGVLGVIAAGYIFIEKKIQH